MRSGMALRAFLCLLVLAPLAPSQDTKALADEIIRVIRPSQNADGSFGTSFEQNCRVLNLLSRSPRRYTELDGPFFRRAAEQVVAHAATTPRQQAWTVLALAGCVTAPMQAARNSARDALAAHAQAWSSDELSLFALRSAPPESTRWGQAAADATPALRLLLAAEPNQVEAPPGHASWSEDNGARAPAGQAAAESDTERSAAMEWTRWARAARLRGLTPSTLPPLPSLPEDNSLDALLDALERVVVQHGLPRPGMQPGPAMAQDDRPAVLESAHDLRAGLEHALAFLDAHQTGGTFGLELPGWSGPEPGITALCLSATLATTRQLGQSPPDWVDSGLDYLRGLQRPDGAILDYGLAVYTTSVALEALIDGGRPQDSEAVAAARDFLISMQADEDLGYDSLDDPHYGGIGYGGDERPDLSNTQMALEAASRAGLPEDSSFVAKTLTFLQRNQNLAEVNTERWNRVGGGEVVSGSDGGATYMPGNSPAGEDQQSAGVYQARSYGSMTYALTKSYLLCGLEQGDQRLDAALNWILSHYTLEENPGFSDPKKSADGLYYYYLALARTLRMIPDEQLVSEQGALIPWRRDLRRKLLGNQRTDGSWFNAMAPRWFEGAPTLCTAFALLSLSAADDHS